LVDAILKKLKTFCLIKVTFKQRLEENEKTSYVSMFRKSFSGKGNACANILD
jgi:hypothetical protein